MEVLKTVQWSLSLMGYNNSQEQRLCIKQVRRGLEALLIIILHFLYVFLVADTIQEYFFSIFMTITMTGIFISFVSTAKKAATIFILIEKIDKIYKDGRVNKLQINDDLKKIIIIFPLFDLRPKVRKIESNVRGNQSSHGKNLQNSLFHNCVCLCARICYPENICQLL